METDEKVLDWEEAEKKLSEWLSIANGMINTNGMAAGFYLLQLAYLRQRLGLGERTEALYREIMDLRIE
jgi:urocanate hydratase